jgi:hypothetical protein
VPPPGSTADRSIRNMKIDGREESARALKTKNDAAIKNAGRYILSR